MRAVPLALALLLAACVLAACGSESERSEDEGRDRAEIEAVAARFDSAVAGRDAKAFCALLSPRDKGLLRREGKRCLVVWGGERNPLFEADDPELSVVEVTRIAPPTATARLANGGELVFLREQGSWYVNLAPAKK